jgi:hypothetical protein
MNTMTINNVVDQCDPGGSDAEKAPATSALRCAEQIKVRGVRGCNAVRSIPGLVLPIEQRQARFDRSGSNSRNRDLLRF